MSRPTEITIDLAALRHNLQVAKSLSPNANIVAVVKADAYGHGVIDVTNELSPHVEMFAVSCVEEAMVIRRGGVDTPILLLEGGFCEDDYELAAEYQFHLVIHSQQQLDFLSVAKIKTPLNIWLKIDSGMHRLGIEANTALDYVNQLRNMEAVGAIKLMTHFASADEVNRDFTTKQLNRFTAVVNTLQAKTGERFALSMANSAALIQYADARAEWDRPGIMLYGVSPFEQNNDVVNQLTPVMSFTSKIIALRNIDTGESVGYGHTWTATKPSTIATVAVGYGDGYPRSAQSGTPVLVNGQRAKLAGRVSMDMISVDVSDLKDVAVGNNVELWGKRLSVNEVASWAGTIGYELVTRMPKRTKRRFEA